MWPLSLMHHTLITCWNDSVLDILGFWKSYLPSCKKCFNIITQNVKKKMNPNCIWNGGQCFRPFRSPWKWSAGNPSWTSWLIHTAERESWPYWALWWDWHKKECLFIWYCFTKDKCQNTLSLLVKVVVFHEYTNIVCIWEMEKKYEADIITLIPVSILILRLLLWLI